MPHFIVGRTIKKRTSDFNAKFPDAIELLVRGLRSGLPVTETLAVVAQEVPGPVGEEFKGVVERDDTRVLRAGRSRGQGEYQPPDGGCSPRYGEHGWVFLC